MADKVQNSDPIKLALIGDHGVGRTSFVGKFSELEKSKSDLPSAGAQVHHVVFPTNLGPVGVDIWDFVESEGDVKDAFFAGSQCAVIMFDVVSLASYKNVPPWHRAVSRICPEIPMVLCGNKIEAKDRAVHAKDIQFHRKKAMQYYDISVHANYNIEKPILWLLRRVTKNPELVIVGEPYTAPTAEMSDALRHSASDDEDLYAEVAE